MRNRVSPGRTAATLVFFGASFGYVEAAVVVYLRAIYEPVRAELHPASPPGELFPLITAEQLRVEPTAGLLKVELAREVATLVLLGSIALAVTAKCRQWLAAFAVAFGVWDIAFYVFLKVLIGWPASLFTWDLLFLLPVPWAGPVIAPVIVSTTMIAAGLTALARPMRSTALPWLGIVAGGLIVVLSFTWDYRNTMAGGLPNPFAWRIFALGELIGVASFAGALRRPRAATVR